MGFLSWARNKIFELCYFMYNWIIYYKFPYIEIAVRSEQHLRESKCSKNTLKNGCANNISKVKVQFLKLLYLHHVLLLQSLFVTHQFISTLFALSKDTLNYEQQKNTKKNLECFWLWERLTILENCSNELRLGEKKKNLPQRAHNIKSPKG